MGQGQTVCETNAKGLPCRLLTESCVRSLSDLADAYEKSKDYENAIDCEMEALEIAVNSFGKDHGTAVDLAENLKDLERMAKRSGGYSA